MANVTSYIKAQIDALIAAKYTKPSGGIPSTDMTAAVQTSLGKADTALQSAPASPVTSVAGKTGAVSLVKADVGLGSVDNTADTAKPVSTAQATADTAVQNFAIARGNHTGTQSADTLTDGTTNKAFLATERTKLTGIATGATANSPDATLLARANHTGTQLLATISDAGNAAGKSVGTTAGTVAAGDDPRIVGAAQQSSVPGGNRLAQQIRTGVPCTDVTMAFAPESITLGAAAGTSWRQYTIECDVAGLWLVIPNKRASQATTSPNYSDFDPATSLPVKASIKVVSSSDSTNVGTVAQARFNGATTATIDPSGEARTDFIALPLPAGSVIEVRVYTSATSWAPSQTSQHSGQGMGFVSGSDQTATAGALTSSSGSLIQPSVILGKPLASASTPRVALAVCSMSIDAGAVDDQSLSGGYNTGPLNTLTLGGCGHLARACRAGNIPVVNASLPGDQVANFVKFAYRYARSSVLPHCTDAVVPNPTNDIASNTFSLAQVQANVIKALGFLGAGGLGLRLWAGTVTPRSTSSDAWTTLANQGVASGVTETIRVNYNSWLRDGMPVTASGSTWAAAAVGASGGTVARSAVYGPTGALATAASGPAHPVAGVFDTATTVESALNSGKWSAPATLAGLSISSASNALVAGAPAFAAGDVGKIIVIPGAGAAGASLVTTVFAYTDSTHVTLSGNAGTTVSSVAGYLDVASNDGTHPGPFRHAAMAAAVPVAAIAVPA